MERLQGILALESSGYSDVIGYALWIAIALVALVIGRLIVRSVVNKRVHGVTEMGVTFGDLKSMQDKGLVSDAEYKTMRQRMAQRELREISEAEEQGKAGDLLLTLEVNPARAGELIGPGTAAARASLANRTEVPAEAKIDHDLYFGSAKSGDRLSLEDQLREQLGLGAESSAESSAALETEPSGKPTAQPRKAGKSARPQPSESRETPAPPSAIMAEADAPEAHQALTAKSPAKPPAKPPATPKAIDPLEAHITRAPRQPQSAKRPVAPAQSARPAAPNVTPMKISESPAKSPAKSAATARPVFKNQTTAPAVQPASPRSVQPSTSNAPISTSAAPKPTAASKPPRASKPHRPAPAPAPPPISAADGRRDLDVLLERGHLSREEYDRLAAIIDQTERDRQLLD